MATTQHIAALHTTQPAGDPPRYSGRTYRHYLLWAVLIPAIIWCAAFPLVASRSYEQWGETEWGPILEFPFEPAAPDADVVIWGDSSAFLGINPKQINQQLGIQSVVLPSTVGSLPVMGDAPLRYYLARHRQPKLIVLYFSPWNLDFGHLVHGRVFEGEEMMIRHGSAREIVHYALHHPVETLAFPVRLYSTFGSKMLVEFFHGKSREQETVASLGHAPYDEPFPPLQDLCLIPAKFLKQGATTSVDELRTRFERPGTSVMVYLAPVPGCKNSSLIHNRSFSHVDAAPPAVLPPTDFAADPYYAHIRPANVGAASELLAQALRSRLEQVAPQLLHSTP